MKTNIYKPCFLFGLILFSLVSLPDTGTAQVLKFSKSEVKTAPLQGVVDLMNVKENFSPCLQSTEIEDESGNVSKTVLVHTDHQSEFYREDVLSENSHQNKLTVETPAVFQQFNGSSDNQYTPPDNSIAVSNTGYVFSCMNSRYLVFPPDGNSNIRNTHFHDALLSSLPKITDVYYDPRVIYDMQNDRFIVVVLNGSLSSTSHIVILFSKSGNPADGWNAYDIAGDVFGKNQWTDYPNIGLSKSDLFVTGNMFDNQKPNSQYQEAMILQIDKSKGYNGQALSYHSFELSKPSGVFTIVPASEGLGNDYGDTMYLVSNILNGGNSMRLFTITGNEASGNALISTSNPISYTSLYYSSPAPSGQKQQGTSNISLNAGDSRIKQAFFLNGILHFVFSTQDQFNSYTDLVYGRLDVSSKLLTNISLGASTFNYVYPSIASIGVNNKDKSVLICYLKSGSSKYAEADAVQCDNNMNFSSSIVISPGTATVLGDGSTPTVRWGDYTGLARRYTTNSCFFAGHFGAGNAYQNTIAEIGLKSTKKTGISPETLNTFSSEISIFPNPVTDYFTLNFDVEQLSHINIALSDIQGRQISLLYDGFPTTGNQKFSFNKATLAPGIYSLIIKSDHSSMITRKIIVE